MGSNSLTIAITGDIDSGLEVFTKVQKAVTDKHWDLKRFIITSAATKSIFYSSKGAASMPCTCVDIKSSQPKIASAPIVQLVKDTIQKCTHKTLQYNITYGVQMVSSEMGMVTEVCPSFEAIGKTEGVKA